MHRLQQTLHRMFESRSPEAVRQRQRILKRGKYTCNPHSIWINTGKGKHEIKRCPFWQACSALPQTEPALCESEDADVGIDTMSDPICAWNFELTIKAEKTIPPDPLEFGEDE